MKNVLDFAVFGIIFVCSTKIIEMETPIYLLEFAGDVIGGLVLMTLGIYQFDKYQD